MSESKRIVVRNLDECIRRDEFITKFEKPIEGKDLSYLARDGFLDPAHRAETCLGWIWRQWLLGNSRAEIVSRVSSLIRKGLELRGQAKVYDYLPAHDLFLVACAVLGATDSQMREVAVNISDASGDKGRTPSDRGELYAAAWSGVIKYWILGDFEKAQSQADLIWGSYRDRRIKGASKSLLTPWLKKDWSKFLKEQRKDFEKHWLSIKKGNHWSIKAETDDEIVMVTDKKQIGHMWCWAHCVLAILAHKEGVSVVTDPYWFPEIALRT